MQLYCSSRVLLKRERLQFSTTDQSPRAAIGRSIMRSDFPTLALGDEGRGGYRRPAPLKKQEWNSQGAWAQKAKLFTRNSNFRTSTFASGWKQVESEARGSLMFVPNLNTFKKKLFKRSVRVKDVCVMVMIGSAHNSGLDLSSRSNWSPSSGRLFLKALQFLYWSALQRKWVPKSTLVVRFVMSQLIATDPNSY